MTLLSGDELEPKAFFTYDDGKEPSKQASSFDLTIGRIFNSEGKEVSGSFVLEPGHMVQVVSAQSFNLSNEITGHVTYKTSMTREGVWALTVGIVDPGWKGPIATTLLNFSSVKRSIEIGEEFLRVSLFQHSAVREELIRKTPSYDDYVRDVRKLACQFPPTFLDHDGIAKAAGDTAVTQIRDKALAWVVGLGFLFAILQVIGQIVGSFLAPVAIPEAAVVKELRTELKTANERIDDLKLRLEDGRSEGGVSRDTLTTDDLPPSDGAPRNNASDASTAREMPAEGIPTPTPPNNQTAE